MSKSGIADYKDKDLAFCSGQVVAGIWWDFYGA